MIYVTLIHVSFILDSLRKNKVKKAGQSTSESRPEGPGDPPDASSGYGMRPWGLAGQGSAFDAEVHPFNVNVNVNPQLGLCDVLYLTKGWLGLACRPPFQPPRKSECTERTVAFNSSHHRLVSDTSLTLPFSFCSFLPSLYNQKS